MPGPGVRVGWGEVGGRGRGDRFRRWAGRRRVGSRPCRGWRGRPRPGLAGGPGRLVRGPGCRSVARPRRGGSRRPGTGPPGASPAPGGRGRRSRAGPGRPGSPRPGCRSSSRPAQRPGPRAGGQGPGRPGPAESVGVGQAEDGVDAAADHPGADAEDDADLGVGWGKAGVAGGREVAGGPFDQLRGGEAAGAVGVEVIAVQQVGEAAGPSFQQTVDDGAEPGGGLGRGRAAAGPPTSRSRAGSGRR